MSDDMPPTRRRRWLLPVLFLSLALNLLIAGAFIGRAMAPDGPGRGERVSGPVRSVIGEPFVRALSKDDRQALFADIKRDAPRIRESRKDLRARFEAFLSALRADPFDTGEVQRLLEAQRQVARGRLEFGETLLLRRLEEMSAEERAAYADRLERSLRRLRRR